MLKGHLCSIYISPRRSLLHIKWMLKYWCVASSYECSKMTLASLWLNLVHLPSIEAHWCTFAIHWCTHQSKQPKISNLSTWKSIIAVSVNSKSCSIWILWNASGFAVPIPNVLLEMFTNQTDLISQCLPLPIMQGLMKPFPVSESFFFIYDSITGKVLFGTKCLLPLSNQITLKTSQSSLR